MLWYKMNTNTKVSLDDYVAKYGVRTKRSRLDAHADEIAAAVERGLTLTQIADWLSINGVAITQPGLTRWMRIRAEQATRRAETLTAMPAVAPIAARSMIGADQAEQRRESAIPTQPTATDRERQALSETGETHIRRPAATIQITGALGNRGAGAPSNQSMASQLRALAEDKSKQDDSLGGALFKSSGPLSKK